MNMFDVLFPQNIFNANNEHICLRSDLHSLFTFGQRIKIALAQTARVAYIYFQQCDINRKEYCQ